VEEANVASHAGLSESMAACAADAARQARFPPPGPRGATISVPFDLVLGRETSPTTDLATSQATADAIVQRIQTLRDSIAVKHGAAGSSRDCVRRSLDQLDALLESARQMVRDAQRDSTTDAPAQIEQYLPMLRRFASTARSVAGEADRCP
jgi:hypothetical protein